MVVDFEPHANRIVIHVDGTRPDTWRRQTYYSQIKQWSLAAAHNRGQVVVWQGLDAIAVLPDRDVVLGPVREDQLIITSERHTPFGLKLDVMLMDRNDPRLAGMKVPTKEDPTTKYSG